MERRIRWTSAVALTISTLSLALTGWLVACRSSDPTPGVTTTPDKQVTSRVSAVVASVAPATDPAPLVGAVASAPASAPSARAPEVTAVKAEDVDSKLRVRRIALSRSVKDREPVDPTTTFVASADPLYAFVELENQASSEGEIVITFEKKNLRTGNIELGVPAKHARWRTWGHSRGVKDPGDWYVVVRTKTGKELIRAPFEVTPA